MPNRLALLGATDGPWVDVSRVRYPVLRVTGLGSGVVRVEVHARSGEASTLDLASDGDHRLPELLGWLRCSTQERVRGLLCEVISKKVA